MPLLLIAIGFAIFMLIDLPLSADYFFFFLIRHATPLMLDNDAIASLFTPSFYAMLMLTPLAYAIDEIDYCCLSRRITPFRRFHYAFRR